jgi:hypothetical protein
LFGLQKYEILSFEQNYFYKIYFRINTVLLFHDE